MPIAESEWLTVQPPPGWIWARPLQSGPGYAAAAYGELVVPGHDVPRESHQVSLWMWVREHQVRMEVMEFGILPSLDNNPDHRQPNWVVIYPSREPGDTDYGNGDHRPSHTRRCATCHVYGLDLFQHEQDMLCYRCVQFCMNCNVRIAAGLSYCSGCMPRDTCANCPREFRQGRGLGPNADLCRPCSESFCESCDSFAEGVRFNEDLEEYQCEPCREAAFNQPSPDEEAFDADVECVAERFALTPHPHRPIRLHSIEVEHGRGGEEVAQALFGLGLTSIDHVAGYHQPNEDFCHVERDASTGEGGGELIFSRVNLADPLEAENMARAMRVVRDLTNRRRVIMDFRCGQHHHIDGQGFGVQHVRNLVILKAYLEDPLFRLGAANYRSHRGVSYSTPIRKGEYPTAREFAQNWLRFNEHSDALNVSNYWHAVRSQCGCGAGMIGKYEECECPLQRCTFEFRLWNGTTNPYQMQAYAAIGQSMVSFARNHEHLDQAEYPDMEFLGALNGQVVSRETEDNWYDRLKFMFHKFWFSPVERDSIMYTIRNSELNGLGTRKLNHLAGIEYDYEPEAAEAAEQRAVRGPGGRGGAPYVAYANPNAPDMGFPRVAEGPFDICPECGMAICECDEEPF